MQNINESEMRLEVVGEQRQLEVAVATAEKSAAVFFVPTLLTPLFISSEMVVADEKTGLFTVAPEAINPIPQGLIPDDKMADEKQLSTVLGRVLSVEAMLRAGTKIIVLYAGDRIKSGSEGERVDDHQIQVLTQRDPENLLLRKISPELYAQYKEQICAATYCYSQGAQEHQVGIDATQINTGDVSQNWGVRREEVAQQKAQALNSLLKQLRLPSIQEIKNSENIHTKQSPTYQMLRFGIFAGFAAATAYVGFKILTKENDVSSKHTI